MSGTPPAPRTADQMLAWLDSRRIAASGEGRSWPWAELASAAPMVVVGAGGSHPAADYVARLLRDHGTVARAAYPLDAAGPETAMIAVSYSGRTPDIGEAIRRFRAAGGTRVVLVTGNRDGSLSELADLVVVHRPPHETGPAAALERGFLSFAATVAPCAAALAAATGHTLPDLRVVVGGARSPVGQLIDVVAGGWAWSAALDLESKWVEAGLGTVRLHEPKNLSHGRFQTVLTADVTVVHLVTGPLSGYDRALRDALFATGAAVTTMDAVAGADGGLALLDAVQGWPVAAGTVRSIDVSRPGHIAPAGVALHHWVW